MPIVPSKKTSFLSPLKLIAHHLCWIFRRSAFDPVRFSLFIQASVQRILSRKPKKQSDRGDQPIEKDSHDDGIGDLLQQKTESRPNPIERLQGLRMGQG